MKKKFEYKVCNSEDDESHLNIYGKEGWELVYVIAIAPHQYSFIFKREIIEPLLSAKALYEKFHSSKPEQEEEAPPETIAFRLLPRHIIQGSTDRKVWEEIVTNTGISPEYHKLQNNYNFYRISDPERWIIGIFDNHSRLRDL